MKTVYPLQTKFAGGIKKLDLLIPPQGLRVCKRAEHLLAWCSMLYSSEFDMQHYFHNKEKMTF